MIPNIHRKTISRLIVVQSVYQWRYFMQENSLDKIVKNTIKHYKNTDIEIALEIDLKLKMNPTLVLILVQYIQNNIENLETKLNNLLKPCTYQPEKSILCIMIVAFAELSLFDTCKQAIISDFCNLTSSISNTSKVAVVNAILAQFAGESYTKSIHK